MKVTLYTLAFLAIASVSQADITGYTPHTNQATNDSYYDPTVPFFAFTHSVGGSPSWINLNDSYHASYASATYDQDIQAGAGLVTFNPNLLQFSGYHDGSTKATTSPTTDVLSENFTDQYVDFALDSAGTVFINLQGSYSYSGVANNFIGVWFDGNLLSMSPVYVTSFATTAGNHTVRMEFQEESLAGVDYGVTSSSTTMNLDYSVIVTSQSVPEPATMVAFGAFAVAAIRRKKAPGLKKHTFRYL